MEAQEPTTEMCHRNVRCPLCAPLGAHIAELEANLESLRHRLDAAACEKLRILIRVHDTFKRDAAQGVGITHPRSHASLARAFLAEFCQDEDLLAMVQYHDEGHALWLGYQQTGRIKETRLESLLAAIRDWDLFLAFCIVDSCTASKDDVDPMVFGGD